MSLVQLLQEQEAAWEKKNESYNGWTNWDTWNAFNWISSDEHVFNVIQSGHIGTDGLKGIVADYAAIDGMNPEKVNYAELMKAIRE